MVTKKQTKMLEAIEGENIWKVEVDVKGRKSIKLKTRDGFFQDNPNLTIIKFKKW